jgi:flotillin
VPALFELLSGTRIGDLMNRVPALAQEDKEGQNSANKASANGTGATVDATATTEQK